MAIFDEYVTYRRVNVNGNVGRVYYGALLLVLVMIVIFMCGSNKSHLHLDGHLPGTVWSRLQQPRHAAIECAEGLGACDYWDWLDAIETGPTGTFIATYVQERVQRRACPHFNASCSQKPWMDVSETEFFVASPEQLELVLEHRVFKDIQGHPFRMDNVDTEGLLLPKNYSALHITPNGLVYSPEQALRTFSNASRDAMPVHELLTAAGVSLVDPVCTDCGDLNIQGVQRSLRRWGAHLDMTIIYSNLWTNLGGWFLPGPVRYAYQLRHIPTPEGVRTIRTLRSTPYLEMPADGEARVVRRTYGIKIAYHQTGLIGVPSSVAFLAFIIGCLTLLGVPYTISELYISVIPLFRHPDWYNDVVKDARKKEQ